jgi:disulfide bond formation protein DsbB
MSTAVAAADRIGMSPAASPGWPAAVALCGSGAILLGALAFQHIGGYPPCSLCYWQRYGHVGVMALAWLALLPLTRAVRIALLSLTGLALLVTAGIALYHVGVEWKWWAGPSGCTSSSIGGVSVDKALDMLRRKPVVLCDKIAWSMFGISMAGWNVLLSALLGGWVLSRAWLSASRAA